MLWKPPCCFTSPEEMNRKYQIYEPSAAGRPDQDLHHTDNSDQESQLGSSRPALTVTGTLNQEPEIFVDSI